MIVKNFDDSFEDSIEANGKVLSTRRMSPDSTQHLKKILSTETPNTKFDRLTDRIQI